MCQGVRVCGGERGVGLGLSLALIVHPSSSWRRIPPSETSRCPPRRAAAAATMSSGDIMSDR